MLFSLKILLPLHRIDLSVGGIYLGLQLQQLFLVGFEVLFPKCGFKNYIQNSLGRIML